MHTRRMEESSLDHSTELTEPMPASTTPVVSVYGELVTYIGWKWPAVLGLEPRPPDPKASQLFTTPRSSTKCFKNVNRKRKKCLQNRLFLRPFRYSHLTAFFIDRLLNHSAAQTNFNYAYPAGGVPNDRT